MISGVSRAIVRFTLFKPTIRILGEKKMKILGLSILTVVFILIGIFGAFYPAPWIFIVLLVFASYGVSCARGLMMSKVTETVSPKEIGKINGYTSTLDSLAQIFGPVLGTFLLSPPLLSPFLYGSIMGILAFVALMMVFKKIVSYREKVKF